jgi:hypothetical protein
MAAAPVPFKPAAKAPETPHEALAKEMNKLLTRARDDRSRHEGDLNDCYTYAMPWRHRFRSTQPGTSYAQVYDETISIVLQDFAADMLNTFTPQKNNWLSEEPAVTMRDADKAEITKPLKARQNVIFSEMSRSSLYPALQEGYLDLGPGTMALLINDIGATRPIHCEAIPISDLLIVKGPFGLVSGVFREDKCHMRSEVKVLWPDADLSVIGPEPQDPDTQELKITDGCWRDWNDVGTETYKYAVMCNGKIILRRTYTGAGSCPFIVARWLRDPTTAWGVGPTRLVIKAILTANHVRYLDLKSYDKHVDPPMSYEDDGVSNFEGGIVPGDYVPRAVGSEAPEAMESKSRFDVAVFERDEGRSIIRRAHYQDKPEQQGKTPPTATQWADERAERARRMGTPATNLVLELQIPIYQRFSYILEQRGALPKVKLNGADVALQPVSPLLRAQEQEEVIRLDRFAEMIAARFGPAIANVIINQIKYAARLAELLGIPKDLLRNEVEIKGAIEQFAGLLQQGNAPAPISAEGAAPPPLGAIGP